MRLQPKPLRGFPLGFSGWDWTLSMFLVLMAIFVGAVIAMPESWLAREAVWVVLPINGGTAALAAVYFMMRRTNLRHRTLIRQGFIPVAAVLSTDDLVDALDGIAAGESVDRPYSGWERLTWGYSLVLTDGAVVLFGGPAAEPRAVVTIPWAEMVEARPDMLFRVNSWFPGVRLIVDRHGSLHNLPLVMMGKGFFLASPIGKRGCRELIEAIDARASAARTY